MDHLQGLAFLVLLGWLAFLFSGLGIVAGVYLAVNLHSTAQYLHMSDTFAGVTVLALGNGAPDIFSTIAAMNRSSHNLALGELLGAAAFITSVIPGSMALLQEFEVVKLSLVRDASFLLITIGLLSFVMNDGYLRLWHCGALAAIYVSYTLTVAGQHWWQSHVEKDAVKAATQARCNTDQRIAHGGDTEPLLVPDHGCDDADTAVQHFRHHHYSNLDSSSWDEELWYTPNAQILDHRSESDRSMARLHKSHWAYQRDTQFRKRVHGYHGHQSSPDPGATANTTAIPFSTSQSPGACRKILSAAFQVLISTRDDGETFSTWRTILHVIMLPMNLAFMATIPRVEEGDETDQSTNGIEATAEDTAVSLCPVNWHNRCQVILQWLAAPQLMTWLVGRQLDRSPASMLWPHVVCIAASTTIATVITLLSLWRPALRWPRITCITGFVVSVAWLSILADEIVAVLTLLGFITNVPDAVMGLTVFAVGNSVDDLAADLSIARQKHPLMALGACFGGPLLNILMGLSISGVLVILKEARSTGNFMPIQLQPSTSLLITSGGIMLNISGLLFLMLWTRWRMTRLVACVLCTVWLGLTAVNVYIELKK